MYALRQSQKKKKKVNIDYDDDLFWPTYTPCIYNVDNLFRRKNIVLSDP
jgi:hypothetical protein